MALQGIFIVVSESIDHNMFIVAMLLPVHKHVSVITGTKREREVNNPTRKWGGRGYDNCM